MLTAERWANENMEPSFGEARNGNIAGPLPKRLAVVTATYAQDYELCVDLHQSILQHAPSGTIHYLITPRADQKLFSGLSGPRCVVLNEADLFPRHIVAANWLNAFSRLVVGPASPRIVAINLRQPLPPIRGWIIQQLAKIAVASVLDADILLLADSDVQLVRSFTAENLLHNGRVPLYRKMGEVDAHLPRHLAWNKAARKLLALPDMEPPYPDYVSSFMVWERSTVLALHQRVQEATGRHWIDAVTAHVHFSEWTLYGMFVDEVVGAASTTDSTRCHSYWESTPLSLPEARAFVHGLASDDLAVMIHSKSNTPIEVRRAAVASLASAGK
jgi:hypothetical protein